MDDPYPYANMLPAQAVLYWIGAHQRRPSNYRKNLAHAIKLMESQTETQPHDFWAAIGNIDAQLLNFLMHADDETLKSEDGEKVDLGMHYSIAWKRYGTARELATILDHLEFLVAIFQPNSFDYEHDSENRKKKRKEFYSELKSIAVKLAGFGNNH